MHVHSRQPSPQHPVRPLPRPTVTCVVSPLPQWIMLTWEKHCTSDGVWLERLLPYSLWSLSLGDISSHVKTLMQPDGEFHRTRNGGGILPTASTNSPTTGGSHLGRGPPAHCHTVRWPQPWLTCWLRPHEGPWDRPVLLSHSWIPDPQKPSKRRNVYCSFKPRSFKVT